MKVIAIALFGFLASRPVFAAGTDSLTPDAIGLSGPPTTAISKAGAATIWSGPRVTFSKPDYGDPALPANQDRLTDNVWLTRDSSRGLFNAAKEKGYDGSSIDSPLGTEWADGTTANYATLDYQAWINWVGESPRSVLGRNGVVHLVDDDIYLDITFTSWTPMGAGGGFSYQRSTPAASGGSILGVVEYYHAAFDHYFITRNAGEIAMLDDGAIAGWTRTGLTFNVYATATTGASSVCRFFSTAFGPKSSHFYTPFPTECSSLKSNGSWQFEGEGNDVFFIPVANVDGTCTNGTSAVYRLYNNGQGAAPNHRYTIATNVRDQMIAAGWVIEGNGPGFAFMCAPQS